jgi:hypothetical protein
MARRAHVMHYTSALGKSVRPREKGVFGPDQPVFAVFWLRRGSLRLLRHVKLSWRAVACKQAKAEAGEGNLTLVTSLEGYRET